MVATLPREPPAEVSHDWQELMVAVAAARENNPRITAICKNCAAMADRAIKAARGESPAAAERPLWSALLPQMLLWLGSDDTPVRSIKTSARWAQPRTWRSSSISRGAE